MTKKRIHLIYSILLSAALIVAGLCLIAACISIYRGVYQVGEKPYSPQAVAAAFRPIAIPVYTSLALLLGSILLNIFMPVEKAKKPVEKQYAVILERLKKKVDLSQCDPDLQSAILKEEMRRKVFGMITLILLAIGSTLFLLYSVTDKHFSTDNINASMIKAMLCAIPCLTLPFGYGIFTAYDCRRSLQKEIELVKQAIANGCPAPAPESPAPATATKNYLAVAKSVVIVAAIALIILGIFNGGTVDVLTKAVNICTECVGLG